MKTEIAQQTAYATPPVAVVVAHTVFGLTLNEWVAVATLIYLGLQGAFLIYKWVKGESKSQ